MKTFLNLLLLICLVMLGCDGVQEFKAKKSLAQKLVKNRAPRGEVIQAFGTNYIDYSKSGTNWNGLVQFFKREPQDRWTELRQKAAKYPNIIHYSSMEVMVWIFLDENEKAVDCAISAQ